MSTEPVSPVGTTAVRWLSSTRVKERAGMPPKATANTWLRSWPVRVTVVPPADGPMGGLTLSTSGWVWYVKWSELTSGLTPAGAVTVTSTVPGDPGGVMAVISESESTSNWAAWVPKSTWVAPVKPVPRIWTRLSPSGGPGWGDTPVTVTG